MLSDSNIASGFCDLHIHSLFSDGTDTPRSIVAKASDLCLRAIAITDHDTMNGVPEALESGREYGVLVIPGVELSVDSPCGVIHLLGYGISWNDIGIQGIFRRIIEGRVERNVKIIEKLCSLGMELSMAEVKSLAGNCDVVGRPHIAKALIMKKYASSPEEVFTKYLGSGGKAYAERYRPKLAEAVDIIHKSGGVAVVAHPGFYKNSCGLNAIQIVDVLRSDGIDGVECYYSHHTADLTMRLIERCRKYHLLVTGGSDYHGLNKDNIALGVGTGNMRIPSGLVLSLMSSIRDFRQRFTI
ncbi:PHP domain-containing protein [Candidatus Sumerlaeota bacterium]|nr:PHP domain-containing protein [Candidatus Sumerlaeota bacterium]